MPPPSSSTATATSVQVAVRIRPTTTQDSNSIPQRFQRAVIHATENNQVQVEATSGPPTQGTPGITAPPPKKQIFNFDQVHAPNATQYSIFTTTAQPLVTRFLEGFNCTVLAYGQTSSGKTYTMTGVDLDANPTDSNNGMGIIPRAVANIFSRAQQLRNERAGAWKFEIKGSFIELYNEDLNDLLADDASGLRREVQIREDKDGHIIWGGLREITVKSASEVMGLLRQGSSMRRTHETDMNAQSSRSHAVFSLTLIQKKYSGSGAPPRSNSPLPPAGSRSPSRLARPGSMYSTSPGASRVGSPPFGRPPTPSFATAMNKGLRPSSALGHRTGGDEDDGLGEWTTIVSKFHFVDLAGSERLKRTAAQGERAKEGISINSGLLALGNVISALGDPAKSRMTTHVPYRDSKLTRLLQDSLGGNAHTLMIACVSPAEWNIGETINTLKYANRARNIKNRAEIKEKEDGWDDLEWLQAMVTKLRKELKTIKEGGVVPNGGAPVAGTAGIAHVELEGASQKVLQQMVELQSSYDTLRSRYTERTEELTRLRRELEDRRSSAGGAVGGSRKYEEIVGPVIEEYEKTISAMEAELSLNRAALRHTNDMYEEKDEEFNQLAIRHAATEAYVEELRLRVAKLAEHESATESYIRDLEAKLKTIDENKESANISTADLKKEIARLLDVEAHSSQHIAELETRLSKSDENVLSLRASVEQHEHDLASRQAQVEDLQQRMDRLTTDSDEWRASLEAREGRVSELEEKLKEWEAKKQAAAEDRERLGNLVDGVTRARQSLDIEFTRLQSDTTEETKDGPADVGPSKEQSDLQSQFVALQETHTATLADLSAVTSKYRDALREISDLAAQIAEAKLASPLDPDLTDSPAPVYDTASVGRRRGVQRRPTGESTESVGSIGSASSRRLFFRHAASAESLHARSLSQSQSLSQELSSARTPKHSLTANPTGLGSPQMSTQVPKLSLLVPPSTNGILNPAPGTPTDRRTVQSLEKEIMRLQEVLNERETEIGALETTLKELRNPAPKVTALHDVEEDDEEQVLEMSSQSGVESGKLSPATLGKFAKLRRSLIVEHPPRFDDGPSAESETLDRLNELMRSMAQKESQHKEQVDGLTDGLTKLRRQHDDLTVLARDQMTNMSTELEGLRTQLRSAEDKHVEYLKQVEELHKQEAELVEVHRAAAAEHAAAIDVLKNEYEGALATQTEEAAVRLAKVIEEQQVAKTSHEALLAAKQAEVDIIVQKITEEHQTTLSRLHAEIAEAEAKLSAARDEHQAQVKEIQSSHSSQLQTRQAEFDELLATTKEGHEAALRATCDSHKEAYSAKEQEMQEALEALRNQHAEALVKLQEEHTSTSQALQQQSSSASGDLRKKHEEELSSLRTSHEAKLAHKESTASTVLERLRDEHAALLKKLTTEHEEALSKKEADLASQISRLKEDHAAHIQQAELARAGSLSESQSVKADALQRLQEQHTADVERREKAFLQDLETAKVDHAKVITSKEQEFAGTLEKLRQTFEEQSTEAEANFDGRLRVVETAHVAATAQLNEAHAAELEKTQAGFLQDLNGMTVDHHKHLATKEKEFEQVLAQHRAERETALAEAVAATAKVAAELGALEKVLSQTKAEYEAFKVDHDKSVDSLRAEHSVSLATLSSVKQERDREHSRLAEALAKSEAALENLRITTQAELASSLQSVKQEHVTTLESLSKEHSGALSRLRAELDKKYTQATAAWEAEKAVLQRAAAEQIAHLTAEHQTAMRQAQADIVTLQEQHKEDLEESRLETDMLLSEERERQVSTLEELEQLHQSERDTLLEDRDLLAKQLAAVSALTEGSSQPTDHRLDQMRVEHEIALNEKLIVITRLEQEITAVMKERREYSQEVDVLRTELERVRAHGGDTASIDSRRDSLVQELDRHRSVIGDLRVDLQKTKDAMDNLQAEKARQEGLLRDLQDQLSNISTARNSPVSEVMEDIPGRARVNGVPPLKPPPAGALPSVPGSSMKERSQGSVSSRSVMTMSSSLHSHNDSMGGHVPSTPATSVLAHGDIKLTQQLEEQTKQLEEKEIMIKTLHKQLTHCEGDLQTHMDLVSTLENSLNDSERNLRKTRAQGNDLARERDKLTQQLEAARNELEGARKEMTNVRNSVIQEKQSLEQRLDEERKAKERARAQLDSRMEELQKRKSKFACL